MLLKYFVNILYCCIPMTLSWFQLKLDPSLPQSYKYLNINTHEFLHAIFILSIYKYLSEESPKLSFPLSQLFQENLRNKELVKKKKKKKFPPAQDPKQHFSPHGEQGQEAGTYCCWDLSRKLSSGACGKPVLHGLESKTGGRW